MRFTLIKDLKKDSSMNPILKGLLLFILLYLCLDLLIKYSTIGLTYDSIFITLFGNNAEYIDPMPQSIFLEFIHMEIFFLMMILLTLNAIFIRLMHQKNFSIITTHITMISALTSLVSITIAYFYSDMFIIIFIISFIIWHICAIYMALSSLWKLSFA